MMLAKKKHKYPPVSSNDASWSILHQKSFTAYSWENDA